MVEKFKTWSDCGDDIESSYSKDQLLENIMLYWVTGTINSAMRFYYECIGPNAAPQDDWAFVTVPTAHARFPAEIRPTPRPTSDDVRFTRARAEYIYLARRHGAGHKQRQTLSSSPRLAKPWSVSPTLCYPATP